MTTVAPKNISYTVLYEVLYYSVSGGWRYWLEADGGCSFPSLSKSKNFSDHPQELMTAVLQMKTQPWKLLNLT